MTTALLTARAGGRRALKGSLVVLAVALAFIALAGPQYGRGTRLIPATNLDCVLVLDFSKSMYARDVTPSRTERAKAEVARLIANLPGARFGAVAFAGEPISFPLTSDGGAIAQFFRQTSPNDMPIGGTAIARALEGARELLQRDPLSKKHQKVIVLVTDGEDLEGDPVEVAKAARQEGITIHVVQIGSRAPETIPEVGEDGQIRGLRRDSNGKPLTTSLTADGESQLAAIAQATSGQIIRSQAGQTGIDEISAELGRMMTEELAERVETVYADVFYYPLGLALLLLLIEVLVPVARRRKAAVVATALLLIGCEDAEQKVFTRYSPQVDEAIEQLDAGVSARMLSEYLNTGRCESGNIGTPDTIREYPNAAVDMGLVVFRIAEKYGAKFGDDPHASAGPAPSGQDPEQQQLLAQRSQEVDCALRLVRVIAADKDVPLELRAQAYYLSGNLEFLRYEYRSAVDSYDQALRLFPGGGGDAGTRLGTDAAFNRAIALQRAKEEEDNKPPPPDGGAPGDGGESEPSDDKKQDQDDKNQDKQDQNQDQDKQDDQQNQDQQDQDQDQDQQKQDQQDQQNQDQQQDQQSQDQQQDQKGQNGKPGDEREQQPQAAQKAPSLSQDDRVLDQLERAPMFQHAAPRGDVRGRPRMEDK